MSVPIQWVAQCLNLAVLKVVKPEPLNVKEAAKTIERVNAPRTWVTNGTTHPCVTLKSFAAIYRKNKHDCWGEAVSLVKPLLVLALRCPESMTNRLHNVLIRGTCYNKITGALTMHVWGYMRNNFESCIPFALILLMTLGANVEW